MSNTIVSYLNLGMSIILMTMLTACHGQKHDGGKVVGGPFENGEFMYINIPDEINAIDTSTGWGQSGQRILITGTIYQLDGKTPAPDVILYYYHTDVSGRYTFRKGLDKRARKHGYIRGWVQSDKSGEYAIYTVRPAPYPDHNGPAHIHLSVKEPEIEKEYYIDALVFDDDTLLDISKRKALENRGGSGVVRLVKSDDLKIGGKNIILGLNIPNYPE